MTPSHVPRASRILSPGQARPPGCAAHAGLGPASFEHGGVVVNTGERKERRGFASMSPEKQREIASKGGRAAHEKGTAHEARSAGRKGGQVSRGGRGRLIVPSPEPAVPPASPGLEIVPPPDHVE